MMFSALSSTFTKYNRYNIIRLNKFFQKGYKFMKKTKAPKREIKEEGLGNVRIRQHKILEVMRESERLESET